MQVLYLLLQNCLRSLQTNFVRCKYKSALGSQNYDDESWEAVDMGGV